MVAVLVIRKGVVMDLTEFNFNQALKLTKWEPTIKPKIFVMNIKTRSLFKILKDYPMITIDPDSGNGPIISLYGKKIYIIPTMPDNIIGLSTKDLYTMIIHRTYNFSDVTNFVNNQNYNKNEPFRILNIGYIEIGEDAYNHMLNDPASLEKHQFIEPEIY